MKRAKINYFAPDPETVSYRLTPTNEPDDEQRLRAQFNDLVPQVCNGPVNIIAVLPGHQGSFDVAIEGDQLDIEAICHELDVPPTDIDWFSDEPINKR